MFDGHHTLPLKTERQSLIYKCNRVSVEKVPPSKCMKLVLQLLDRKYTNRYPVLNFVRTEFLSNQKKYPCSERHASQITRLDERHRYRSIHIFPCERINLDCCILFWLPVDGLDFLAVHRFIKICSNRQIYSRNRVERI